MKTYHKIRNIIFDLGGVLLNLYPDTALNEFRRMGLTGNYHDIRQLAANPVFTGFETGAISTQSFRDKVRALLNVPSVSDADIDHAWCSMIGDFPPQNVKFLKRLSPGFKLFLFSNTNALHIEKVSRDFFKQEGFSFEELFREVFYSHLLGDRKPNVSSFQKVIALAGINPAETLFVDDMQANVDSAIVAGLRAICHEPGRNLEEVLAFLTDGSCNEAKFDNLEVN